MSRHYYKGWQDRRPAPLRRVKWYQGTSDVRLQFDDTYGRYHLFFSTVEEAEAAFEEYIRSDVTTVDMMGGWHGGHTREGGTHEDPRLVQ